MAASVAVPGCRVVATRELDTLSLRQDVHQFGKSFVEVCPASARSEQQDRLLVRGEMIETPRGLRDEAQVPSACGACWKSDKNAPRTTSVALLVMIDCWRHGQDLTGRLAPFNRRRLADSAYQASGSYVRGD